MARLDSQSLHQYDNAKRLNEIETSPHYHGLVHNMVVDLLNATADMVDKKAKELEAETSQTKTEWTDTGWIRVTSANNGLCHHVGRVLLIAELQAALDRELAQAAAWAIHVGDSKNSIARAMHKNPSNLFGKRNGVGDDIKRLLAAYEAMEKHPDDPAYDEIDVKLHDGYVYTAKRS